MRVRILVIAVFASVSTVPGILAFSAGILPGATASVGTGPGSSGEFRVTSLGWPREARGLAATEGQILWMQTGADRTSGGLWAYDVQTQSPTRLALQIEVGDDVGAPSASDETVTWVCLVSARGRSVNEVRALNRRSGRVFTVSRHGTLPKATRNTVVWVKRADWGRRRPGDALKGVNTVDDTRFAIGTATPIRDVAAYGRWLAWSSGDGDSGRVYAADRRHDRRFELSQQGWSVAIDARRIAWAASDGEDGTAIYVWRRGTRHSQLLCKVRARARSLSFGDDALVWVQDTGAGDVWAYDFSSGRTVPVCSDRAQQADPVMVGRTVFWADKRSGQWELYGRALEQ